MKSFLLSTLYGPDRDGLPLETLWSDWRVSCKMEGKNCGTVRNMTASLAALARDGKVRLDGKLWKPVYEVERAVAEQKELFA